MRVRKRARAENGGVLAAICRIQRTAGLNGDAIGRSRPAGIVAHDGGRRGGISLLAGVTAFLLPARLTRARLALAYCSRAKQSQAAAHDGSRRREAPVSGAGMGHFSGRLRILFFCYYFLLISHRMYVTVTTKCADVHALVIGKYEQRGSALERKRGLQ